MPELLRQRFEEMSSTVSGKQKWALCAAAMLLLFDATADERDEMVRQVLDHDWKDTDMQMLVAKADDGTFRTAINAALKQKSSASSGPIRVAAKHMPDSKGKKFPRSK